jgi:hypothetical protein
MKRYFGLDERDPEIEKVVTPFCGRCSNGVRMHRLGLRRVVELVGRGAVRKGRWPEEAETEAAGVCEGIDGRRATPAADRELQTSIEGSGAYLAGF